MTEKLILVVFPGYFKYKILQNPGFTTFSDESGLGYFVESIYITTPMSSMALGFFELLQLPQYFPGVK